MALLYGRTGRFTHETAGFRPGQRTRSPGSSSGRRPSRTRRLAPTLARPATGATPTAGAASVGWWHGAPAAGCQMRKDPDGIDWARRSHYVGLDRIVALYHHSSTLYQIC
jgi:hypothetical protein